MPQKVTLKIIAQFKKPKHIAWWFTTFVINDFFFHTRGWEMNEDAKIVVLW